MKQQHVVAGSAILASSLLLVLSGCASGPDAMPGPGPGGPDMSGPKPMALSASSVGGATSVPVSLRTPLGQSLFMLVSGSGVQIYECAAKPGSTGANSTSDYAWTFRSPEATLTDASGAVVGKHYAGPTWESTDGSTVVGTLSASSPSTDASAIPWLLLSVKSTTGSGVFTQTKSIQRLQTLGGVALTSACSVANAGAMSRVPYAATYAFFRVGP